MACNLKVEDVGALKRTRTSPSTLKHEERSTPMQWGFDESCKLAKPAKHCKQAHFTHGTRDYHDAWPACKLQCMHTAQFVALVDEIQRLNTASNTLSWLVAVCPLLNRLCCIAYI